MSTITTTSLLAGLTAPPVSGASTGPARSAVARSEASFSRQLEQLRDTQAREKPRTPQPEPRPAPAPPAAPRQASNTAESNARAEAARTARARADRKPEAPARNPAAPSDADAEVRQVEDAAKASEPRQTDATQAELAPTQTPPPPFDADAVTTTLTRTLTPSELPTPEATAPLTEEATSAAAEAGGALASRTPATLAGNDAAGPAGATATDLKIDASTATLRLTGADSASATWQQAQAAASTMAQGIGTQRDSTEGEGALAVDHGFALPGVGAPGTSSITGARIGEVVRAEVSTPATAPEFRGALGAHVSLLARAGVQQAELRLNPAEMGPVSIQIVLDGLHAQVNFGADSALTRQIIESGMPELATALREAGLTLTGGGVSQHAGGQRRNAEPDPQADGTTGSPDNGASADDAAAATSETARRSAARSALGGVDLYA